MATFREQGDLHPEMSFSVKGQDLPLFTRLEERYTRAGNEISSSRENLPNGNVFVELHGRSRQQFRSHFDTLRKRNESIRRRFGFGK